MSNPTPTVDVQAVAAKHRAMWASGDYPKLAADPLLGDATYRGRRGTPSDDAALATLVDALGGVALHAAGLAFTHPVTGAAMAFTCPLPDRIEQILSHLRNRGR